MKRSATKSYAICILMLCSSNLSFAEETVIRSIDLPGASLSQEVIYSSTMKDYEYERDKILEQLKSGKLNSMVNPRDGAWMRVETTATIGFSYQGAGSSKGRKNFRQISAAEEALYRFNKAQ